MLVLVINGLMGHQVQGGSNALGFSAMLTAIEYAQGLGGAQFIERHIITLSKQVKSFIVAQSPKAIVSSYKDDKLQSGLTVFYPFSWQKPREIFKNKATADYVVTELMKHNIKIRSIGFVDPNNALKSVYALRVSTAIFNNSNHLEQMKVALKKVLSSL